MDFKIIIQAAKVCQQLGFYSVEVQTHPFTVSYGYPDSLCPWIMAKEDFFNFPRRRRDHVRPENRCH